MDDGFEYDGRDLEALANIPNYYRWIVDSIRPYLRGRCLEIGAGIGTVSGLLRPHVDHLELVEPTEKFIPTLREKFRADPGVEIVFDAAENYVHRLPAASTDSIVAINVLEHIEHDTAALGEFRQILKPDGHLLIFVPAMRWLYGPIDARYRHFRRYHLDSLRAQVEGAGLRVVGARYFDALGILPWFVMFRLCRIDRFDPRMVGFYDQHLVPIVRRLETAISPPVGKNILLIAAPS